MSLLKYIYISILLFVSLTASAASVENWLDKMSGAMGQLSYQGTLVIRQGDSLQAIEVRQGFSQGESWQTLESQTGENQIIIRKNGQVTTIFPNKKLITVASAKSLKNGAAQSALHPALPENREKLKQFYAITLGSEARIANRMTQMVNVKPRDKYRYGYTFWLDKQSGLLLKCDLVSNKGRVIEQQMYSNIKFLTSSPINQIDESVITRFKKMRLSDEIDVISTPWQALKVPTGFELTRSVKMDKKNPTYHLVFSDGMASVSVFIETARVKATSHVGRSNMGPVNAYSAFFNETYVTAIGEVPSSTVQMIAQSIRSVH